MKDPRLEARGKDDSFLIDAKHLAEGKVRLARGA